MKGKEIKISILNDEYSVIVCWGDTKYIGKTIKRWHKDIADIMLDGNYRGRCYYKAGYHPIIALPSYPKTPEQIGTLAHEAVHAINNIFDMVSEHQRDEIFAHCVGAIVRNTLKIK